MPGTGQAAQRGSCPQHETVNNALPTLKGKGDHHENMHNMEQGDLTRCRESGKFSVSSEQRPEEYRGLARGKAAFWAGGKQVQTLMQEEASHF